uniref:Uncharacterized protein n=1 Tax=Syphacia muris TaxID=451379 RepID=A0A0N5AL67_9BILA
MNKVSSPYDTYIARYYFNKINEKKAELEEINAVKHKKWAIMKAKLSIKYKELVSFYEAAYTLEKERIAAEFEREEKAADIEFEDRLTELMDTLIQECEEQKKQARHEFNNCDIASTSGYTYPTSKKSLRKRPNELLTYTEKRMRSKNPQQVVLQLPETAISDDLEFVTTSIEKAERSNTPDSNSRSSIN